MSGNIFPGLMKMWAAFQGGYYRVTGAARPAWGDETSHRREPRIKIAIPALWYPS